MVCRETLLSDPLLLLVILGLHVKEYIGLCDHLRLFGFLGMVCRETLLSDPLLLLVILLFITPEQVHVIVIITGSSCPRTPSSVGGGIFGRLWELLHAGGEGLDMIVPSERVGSVLGGS